MFKKLATYVFLGLTVLTLSAFSSGGPQPAVRNASSLDLLAVTPPSPQSPRAPLSEIFSLIGISGKFVQQQYQYGPAQLATGFAANVQQSPHAPLSEIFSLIGISGKFVQQQYQYGPALLATGFAAPK